MIFKDYYEILGLPNITSNKNDIRNAYKSQAKKYHPDISKSNTQEIFNDIKEAYDILSDKQKKHKYDRLWLSYVGRNKKENITYIHKKRNKTIKDELKELFLGINDDIDINEDMKIKKSLNIHTSMNLTLKEAFLGTKKNITLIREDKSEKNLKVTVPKYVLNNQILKIKNQGNIDIHTGMRGDLYIKLVVSNEYNGIKIDKLNLITTLEIFPWDAILGGKFLIKIFNEEFSIIIPPGSVNENTFILKKKGFKDKHGKKGDFIINTKIVIPKIISNEEKELYKELKKIHENKQ